MAMSLEEMYAIVDAEFEEHGAEYDEIAKKAYEETLAEIEAEEANK